LVCIFPDPLQPASRSSDARLNETMNLMAILLVAYGL
jgi:hypothetical protein